MMVNFVDFQKFYYLFQKRIHKIVRHLSIEIQNTEPLSRREFPKLIDLIEKM